MPRFLAMLLHSRQPLQVRKMIQVILKTSKKSKLDSLNKADGASVHMFDADWASLMRSFMRKFQQNICFPAQSYYEGFEKRSMDLLVIAEPFSLDITI